MKGPIEEANAICGEMGELGGGVEASPHPWHLIHSFIVCGRTMANTTDKHWHTNDFLGL